MATSAPPPPAAPPGAPSAPRRASASSLSPAQQLAELQAKPPVVQGLAWQLAGPLLFFVLAGAVYVLSLAHASAPLHIAARSLFFLQYPVPHAPAVSWLDRSYGKGPLDIYHAVAWAIALTFIRAFSIKHILTPLGRAFIPRDHIHGLKDLPPDERALARARAQRSTDKKILRFAEQGWCVMYYIPSWTIGLWVASRQPYWPLKMEQYWTDYPATTLDGLFKFYYLFQLGFWLHQLLVINLEAKRSDYVQMSSHHVITIALIASSYTLHYQRIGNAILTVMDPSDILLSAAKCLRYMQWQMSCDVMFGLFMVSWFITRHVLFNLMTYSVYADPQKFIPRVWDAQRHIFFSHTLQRTMLGLLLAMQAILLVWFAMIVRVAYRVVTGGEAHDSRSDEDTDELWDEDQDGTTPATDTAGAQAQALSPSQKKDQ